MSTSSRPSLGIGIVEPKDAVAHFQAKKWLLPSFRWQDIWQQEHARGVAVAGIMRRDLLQAFSDELHTTIKAGGDLRTFSKNMQALLEKKGYWGKVEIKDPSTGELRTTTFNKRRLELIFDVNNRQAQAAGQWSRIQANKARNPFLRYITRDDDKVREHHRAWHNRVLPVDHKFWHEHFPPNGWRCRCRVVALSEKDLREALAQGKPWRTDEPPEATVPYVNPHTGEVRQVPVGVDPGFAYNPGMRPFAGLAMRELPDGALKHRAPPPQLLPTLRMPVPAAAKTSDLMPAGLTPQQYLVGFMAEFKSPTQPDPTGEQLLITDEFFRNIKGDLKIMKRGRERFVKLIAQALIAPDEIWMEQMHHVARGKDVIRRRYVKRFRIDGQTKPVLSVVELGSDGWRGRTGFQAEGEAEDIEMLLDARVGQRVYVRDSEASK